MTELRLLKRGAFYIGKFCAMASPCEVHVEHHSEQLATGLAKLALNEALRIEIAFSRYRTDNELHAINSSGGRAFQVGEEMGRLLDFAQLCFEATDGLFDITSGVLREAWQFDGSANLPDEKGVSALLSRVGWQKVRWQSPWFSLPGEMQVDLGGIGKEYAVDRSLALLSAAAPEVPCLVNFGGDLRASQPPQSKPFWQVGVQSISEASENSSAGNLSLELRQGALATSGDAQRYLLKEGIRYGHVLNPHTGWPTPDSPSSVTVAGDSCVQAGVLSTLAMLKGAGAENFLAEKGVEYWCQR